MSDVNGEMAMTPPPAALATVDTELVVQARSGVEAAREELFRRYREPAYLLGLQLLGNREDALDVAQEAMLRFFASLDRFEEQRPVRPYLLRIVRNRATDLWRRRRLRRAESLDSGVLTRQVVDTAPGPEESTRRRELRRRVWKALAALPPVKREIVVLRDYHDLAYAEIAAVLGIPIGTVMSRLHAARKALRAILVADGFGPPEEDGHE